MNQKTFLFGTVSFLALFALISSSTALPPIVLKKTDLNFFDINGTLDNRYLQLPSPNPLVLPVLDSGKYLSNNGTTLNWATVVSGSGTDTNWQTNFPFFDANLSLYFYRQSDANNVFVKYKGAITDVNLNLKSLVSYRDINASRFKSTVATGTAPLTVASTTKVTNLGADTVDGASVGTSGGTIPLLNGTNTWSANQMISTGVLTGELFRLETSSSSTGNDTYWRNYVQYLGTSTAAMTSLWSYTMNGSVGEIALITANVVATDIASNNPNNGYIIRGMAVSNGTTASLIGTQDKWQGEQNAAWDANITVSGNSVRVSVTGQAVTTIAWSGAIQVLTLQTQAVP